MDFIKNLPTDNLYKFIAIFGLLILSYSLFYQYKVEHDYILAINEVELGENKICAGTIEKELFDDELNKAREKHNKLSQTINEKWGIIKQRGFFNSKEEKELYISELIKLREELYNEKKNMLQFQKKDISSGLIAEYTKQVARLNMLVHLTNYYNLIRNLSKKGCWLGIGMIFLVLGFGIINCKDITISYWH